jgi:hypothetical protein
MLLIIRHAEYGTNFTWEYSRRYIAWLVFSNPEGNAAMYEQSVA